MYLWRVGQAHLRFNKQIRVKHKYLQGPCGPNCGHVIKILTCNKYKCFNHIINICWVLLCHQHAAGFGCTLMLREEQWAEYTALRDLHAHFGYFCLLSFYCVLSKQRKLQY